MTMTRSTFSLRDNQPVDWDRIREILDHGCGYVILEGFPVDDRPEPEISREFEELVGRLGPVTPHGASRQTIWRVAPRLGLDHVPTFSEAAGEAPLHTDNSWVEEPEQYFALLVIRPASDGGESLLFPVPEMLRAFAETAEGPAVIRTLSECQFPFAMPVVFRSETEHAARLTPVVTAPVIRSASNFRFRYDSIQTGFKVRPDLATEESVRAVELFNDFLVGLLRRSHGTRLERGDVLIGNNHTLVHARAEFTDPNRLLLRARIAAGPSSN
jgi:alpha-ketoglutarate-dependent taurine dioxygenase